MSAILRNLALASILFTLSSIAPPRAAAHCDTLDGPVVLSAKLALKSGDLTPVLKWVKKDRESELQRAFASALKVRALGPEARELADRHFFETLVRIHRAGEGAPYTGLKPAGEVEPAVAAADIALQNGNADALVKMVTEAVAAGIRQRFARAVEAKKHAEHNVEAGREYVEAYVQLMHYLEAIPQGAAGAADHHHASAAGGANHAHSSGAEAGSGHHALQ